jgi:release factor glutamine methyltransferase
MILGELISRAKYLADSTNIPETDFLYVLSDILGLSKTELFMGQNTMLSDRQIAASLSAFERVIAHEPPQYITGKAPFFHLELNVCPDVLIPRPETEGLVELLLKRISATNRILDIGTGSGAIAIALKTLCPTLLVDAIDCSPSALQLAKLNALENNADIHFYLGDLLPQDCPVYDVIVSNPPYITASEMELLDTRVKDFEPKQALFGGEDGLVFYRALLQRSMPHLNQDGFLALEHGASQAPSPGNRDGAG